MSLFSDGEKLTRNVKREDEVTRFYVGDVRCVIAWGGQKFNQGKERRMEGPLPRAKGRGLD